VADKPSEHAVASQTTNREVLMRRCYSDDVLFKTWGAKPKKQTDFVETDPSLC
jgi:hypothetical protein